MFVDGFMDSYDKCIRSELDLTDMIEDNLDEFGKVRDFIKVEIGGEGLESVKSRSDHYVICVLVDQECVNAASC